MSFETKQGMAAYAAPSLFQPHRVRQAIRDAHQKKIAPILCYYAGLSSLPITRYLAPMGYDAVWIDWEHTACNVETMTSMVHEAIFMSQGRTMPFVRVPDHSHSAIIWALDAGASVVVPQVNTVEEAKHVMSATKYGKKHNGSRSAPPFRYVPGLTDTPYDSSRNLHQCLNDQAAVMIQIESLEGINNLDAMLTEVPDIDIVWLGSLDCRVSMGLPGNFGAGAEPEWLAAKEKFFEIMKKHDKPYGGFAIACPPFGTAETVKKAAETMSFTIISGDVFHLGMLANDLQQARELVAVKTDKEANGTNGHHKTNEDGASS